MSSLCTRRRSFIGRSTLPTSLATLFTLDRNMCIWGLMFPRTYIHTYLKKILKMHTKILRIKIIYMWVCKNPPKFVMWPSNEFQTHTHIWDLKNICHHFCYALIKEIFLMNRKMSDFFFKYFFEMWQHWICSKKRFQNNKFLRWWSENNLY